jgi:hypothetical protein
MQDADLVVLTIILQRSRTPSLHNGRDARTI